MKIADNSKGHRSMLARMRSFRDSGTQGSALVEMALSLPIMLTVMTGIFSFSLALCQKLELAEAVSNGGRILAVDRGDPNPCSKVTNAIYAGAPTLIQGKMSLTFVLNGVTSSVQNGTWTGTSCAGTGGLANTNMVQGGNAQITATYPCVISVFRFAYPNCTLTQQLTEVVQ
jgi:Flp pilus assembly protein TadG